MFSDRHSTFGIHHSSFHRRRTVYGFNDRIEGRLERIFACRRGTGPRGRFIGRRGRSLFAAFDAVPVQKEDMPERPDAVPMTSDALFAPLDSPLVIPDALFAPLDAVFARREQGSV